MGEQSTRIIKKYPNRRLYDTVTSSYITLADVKQLVLDNTDFQVIDAKSGQDLTRSILLQIILEEEGGGIPMFTSDMLSQIIRFYGHTMQGMMGSYLEKSLTMFVDMQQKLQDQARNIYGDNTKLGTDIWSQFLRFQGPAMQGFMKNYMEQSTAMFLDMQQQLQRQTRNIFGFPFDGFSEKEQLPETPNQKTENNGSGTLPSKK